MGASKTSSVYKLFEKYKTEQEFFADDISKEVAQVLQPASRVDLSAHKILLQLATTGEGLVQLVTTNFDRLFSSCGDKNLQVWQAPKLVDVRAEGLNGLVHLHGRVNEAYDGVESDELIISSKGISPIRVKIYGLNTKHGMKM